jgi:DNA repair exonuclease SbcCD ATPase subunit
VCITGAHARSGVALLEKVETERMSEKKANTQELPTIAPSEDDIASRRTSRRGEPVTSRSRSSAAGVVTNLVIALLIAGLTACGWFIATQNDALQQARAERADAVERLERIERRLSLTDEALDQSDAETQNQLQYWESEIRKLWDVSNKRNRDWIEENQRAVASLQGDLAAQNRSIGEVRAQATDLRRAIGTQEQILEQLTLLDRRAADLLRQQRSLTDTANALEQTTAALERRVSDNEEAVRAIDAFRRDTNARLTRLQERVDARASSGSSGGGTVTPVPSP